MGKKKAFPNGVSVIGDDGMDLRDWFAGQALSGLVSEMTRGGANPRELGQLVSFQAYKIADAMMKARGQS